MYVAVVEDDRVHIMENPRRARVVEQHFLSPAFTPAPTCARM
jgi:hypothetical protein